MSPKKNWCISFTVLCIVAASNLLLAQQTSEITIPGKRVYPESLTSLKDGTLIVGSLGQREVLRIPPGATAATQYIQSGTGDINQVFGVYADQRSNTLWICSDRVRDAAGPDPALKAFDIGSGSLKQSYPLDGPNAFCNDIAVSHDGVVYISDTHQSAIYRLDRGAKTLVLVAKDKLLEGVDGITFGDETHLYVTGVTTGKIVQLTLGKDGRPSSIEEVALSKPLTRPDGMRTLGPNRLVLAENGGHVDILTITNAGKPRANVRTIASGIDGATAVTVTRGRIWAAEGKLRFWEDPRFIGKDPGPFKLVALPLPKN